MKQLKPVVFMTALALMALLGTPPLSLAQEFHFTELDAVNEVLTCFSSGQGTFLAPIAQGDTAMTISCRTAVCRDGHTGAYPLWQTVRAGWDYGLPVFEFNPSAGRFTARYAGVSGAFGNGDGHPDCQ